MRKYWLKLVVAVFASLPCVAGARGESEWQYTLTPYGWLAGLKGDVGARGVVVPVDKRFSDVVDKLDLALMLRGEAHNGTWGVFADGIYLNLADDENTAIGKVKADLQQWLVSAGALYRVREDDKLAVDVGAGGRYIDTDINIKTPAGNASQSKNWIDPILVARVRYQVAEKVFLQMGGDIGGFGVESDLVWQLTGTAGYQLTEDLALLLGYRHLDYDYQEGEFLYNVATSGFGLGLSFDF